MGFIVLLALGAFLLASVSGFFSVWGLAQTYSGIFWFVIAMGIAIEYGKLIAVSFIYRFWNIGPKVLNYYLLIAITAVMAVTAAGHYGFLTSGYQTDSLPLKQVEAQVQVLDQERNRLLQRKIQIDAQISQLPANSVRGRVSLIRQFKTEQLQTTDRLNALDQDLLKLKQQQITTEAHTGPIVFIAKAAHVDTDTATHYLTLLLIFVFDPLAVALTWATNVAIRTKQKPYKDEQNVEYDDIQTTLTLDEPTVDIAVEPISDVHLDELVIIPEPIEEQPILIADAEELVEPVVQPTQPSAISPQVQSRVRRPYSGTWENASLQNVKELVDHYKYLLSKQQNPNASNAFTSDDLWELNAIREVLTKAGLNDVVK